VDGAVSEIESDRDSSILGGDLVKLTNGDKMKLNNLQTKIWKDLLKNKITDAKTTKQIEKLLAHAESLQTTAVTPKAAPSEQESVKTEFNKLDINEFLELKEVVKDILPKITPDNLGYTEFNFEDDLYAYSSKQAMLKWLKEFLHDVNQINKFFQQKLQEFIEEFTQMQ
jgi:hypothetical protein